MGKVKSRVQVVLRSPCCYDYYYNHDYYCYYLRYVHSGFMFVTEGILSLVKVIFKVVLQSNVSCLYRTFEESW